MPTNNNIVASKIVGVTNINNNNKHNNNNNENERVIAIKFQVGHRTP